MMQTPTSSAQAFNPSYTEKARRHKDGSVLLSTADDRLCKLNGVGALTWMILEENPAGLSVDEVVQALSDQFEAINAEGELHYEVSREQLRNDTAQFLEKIAAMNLLQVNTDSRGKESYYIKEGVSGTTSSRETAAAQGEPGRPIGNTPAEFDIRLSKRETLTAFIGLLAFDLLLKFRGFQSLINKVEHWPTAEPRTTDLDTCRRVRAMVDRAQLYYPKKAMCLQHSAVVTCLLRRCGVPAELILAAHEFPIRVHAWSEVAGYVVNDHQNVKNKHREMRRV